MKEQIKEVIKKVQFLLDCILDDLAFNQFYCPKYSIGFIQ